MSLEIPSSMPFEISPMVIFVIYQTLILPIIFSPSNVTLALGQTSNGDPYLVDMDGKMSHDTLDHANT